MKNVKAVVYMVTYKDDFNRKHIAFVKGFSEVKFLEDRFGTIHYEKLQIDNVYKAIAAE